MPYFDDLQQCTAFPGEWKNLVAIGWLAKGRQYKRGKVDRDLLHALSLLQPWLPPDAPTGRHRCGLCGADQPVREESGAHFIPGHDVLYVAPRMISHYIREHEYAPPREFVTAVHERLAVADAAFQAAIARHLTGPFSPPRAPLSAYGGRLAILEGIASVRLRPGMYIGSTGAQGLEHMLFELVGNSLDQHLAGKANRLAIDIDRSGLVTIEDDGVGVPIDVVPEHGRPFIELVFSTLHFTPTLDDHYPHVHARSGLHGVGAGAVSALSSRMEVETRHKARCFRISFEQGRAVEPLMEVGATPQRGTWIRYRPDEAIFGSARHDLRAIRRRLSQLAGLIPKLDILFQGKSLQRPEGLEGWLRELAPHSLKETALVASGTHDGVIVEAAFAWNPRARGKKPKVISFVNCSETRLNGSHVKGLLAAVRATPPTTIDQERVMKGLVALVHVQMSGAQFAGPTKWQLDAEPARIAVQEVVTRALKAAPWWWDRLHEALG